MQLREKDLMDEVCNILKKSVERYGKPSPAFGEQEKIANQPAMCSKDSNGNGLTVTFCFIAFSVTFLFAVSFKFSCSTTEQTRKRRLILHKQCPRLYLFPSFL